MASGVIGSPIIDGFFTGSSDETFTVLRADDPNDDDISDEITFAESSNANGYYDLTFTPDTAGAYRIAWSGDLSGRTFSDTYTVVTAAQFDPAAALADKTITVVAPVMTNGDIQIRPGADYLVSQGRALRWSTDDANMWPVLTGLTIELWLRGRGYPAYPSPMKFVGAIDVATGAEKEIHVEIQGANTYSLADGEYDFEVSAKGVGDHYVPLVAGRCVVPKRVRPSNAS